MHRPSSNPIARAVYNRHTLQHHQFFTEHEMRFADQRDYRVTFFPPYALASFTLMSIPGAIVLGWLFSPNVGWLFITTTTSIYMIYEFMHFCCHVDDNWFVRNMPLINTNRRHHTAHHDQSIMMEKNMNLTFPIMDWLFGTSDLNRGLIGTLFNGYSTAPCEDRHAQDLTLAGPPRRGAGRRRHAGGGVSAMEAIEPNVAALAWFSLFAAVASLSFYVVAGAFPLSLRDDLTRHPAGVPLAIVAALAFTALSVGALVYGAENLRWTSVVIVAGLAILFAPGAFNLWPARWRDGAAGLAIMLGLTVAALAALQAVGGVFAA